MKAHTPCNWSKPANLKRIFSRFCTCSGSQNFDQCSGPVESQFLRFYAAKYRKVNFISVSLSLSVSLCLCLCLCLSVSLCLWLYNLKELRIIISLTQEALGEGGGVKLIPLDFFLALNFRSQTDCRKLWHNCPLFVNTSFDFN